VKVGILALQGAVLEHCIMVEKCGHEAIPIKTVAELKKIDRLIIPGGESTTIGKLMAEYQLDHEIIKKVNLGMPVYGTCAGLILLARTIKGNKQKTLNLIDVEVIRNAFGRQIDSFEAYLKVKGLGYPLFKGVFIRAPYIAKIGKEVEALAYFENKLVMAQYKNIMVSAFHPELGNDIRIHQLFLQEY
jgi:5'-phosphate synthase pdxT subunit